jgi:hypothetical protein
MHDQFNRLVQQTRVPSPAAENMSAGAKLSATLSDVDLDFYYYYGFDPTPLLKLDPAYAESLEKADFSIAKASELGPFFNDLQQGYPPLTIEYVRRHHLGFDAGTVVGPIGLRFDAAYDSARVFVRRDLTGVLSDSLQAVTAIEYQTGDLRKVFLLEASVLRLLGTEFEDLLLVGETTVTGAALVRFPLMEYLDAELRAVATLAPWTVVLRPQLGQRLHESLTLYAGGVWLTGGTGSLGEYFSRNIEAYLAAKYVF